MEVRSILREAAVSELVNYNQEQLPGIIKDIFWGATTAALFPATKEPSNAIFTSSAN